MERAQIEALDDESLYRLSVLEGDTYAQHCFAERLKPRITALAQRWVGTSNLAEEVSAEVLRKLMMTGRTPGVSSVVALSTVATRNVALTVLKSRRLLRERRAATGDYLSRELAQLPPSATELAAEEEDSLEARLRQCIGRLRPEQQATLRCFYFDDLGYEAIAERLGIPTGKVRSHLQNGRKRLRHLMG